MTFDEFKSQARLHAVGALDAGEMASFEQARQELGAPAESYIEECQNLGAAFALSLRPRPPNSTVRERLLALIHQAILGGRWRSH